MAGKKSAATVVAAAMATTAVTAEQTPDSSAGAPKKVTLSALAKELFKTTPIDTEARGKQFRKTILTKLMAEVPGTTIASAAGAYNNAKTAAQKAEPEKYACLGREPGKNNGGPKKRETAVAVTETAEAATV